MLKSSARTKDYVRKQAVVGLGNDRSIVARLIGSSSGNTLMLFDNLEAASDWVAAD